MDLDLCLAVAIFRKLKLHTHVHSWRLDPFRCIIYLFIITESAMNVSPVPAVWQFHKHCCEHRQPDIMFKFYSCMMQTADFHASQKSWFYLLNKYYFLVRKNRRTIFIKRLMSRRRIDAGPIRRRVNTRGYLGKPFTVSPPNVIKSRWLLRAKKSYLFMQNEKKHRRNKMSLLQTRPRAIEWLCRKYLLKSKP